MAELRPRDAQCRLENIVGIDGSWGCVPGPGEGAQVGHDAGDLLGCFVNLPEKLHRFPLHRGSGAGSVVLLPEPSTHMGVEHDRGDGVVDVVGNACGEQSQGCHAVRHHQLLLQTPLRGDVDEGCLHQLARRTSQQRHGEEGVEYRPVQLHQFHDLARHVALAAYRLEELLSKPRVPRRYGSDPASEPYPRGSPRGPSKAALADTTRPSRVDRVMAITD